MVAFSLHPTIEPAALRKRFAASGQVQIAPFLEESQALALAEHLRQRPDWQLIFNAADKVYELPRTGPNAPTAEQEARLRQAINDQARHDFQFCFDSIRVPDDSAARDDTDILHGFADFMCSDATIALMRRITGSSTIDFADAQATLYRAGDFLTAHDDAVEAKHRQAAYVFGLTETWRAEWGGLLLFHDDQGEVSRGLMPRANVLTLFAVPQVHSVSCVTASAASPRCSVTGWLRATA